MPIGLDYRRLSMLRSTRNDEGPKKAGVLPLSQQSICVFASLDCHDCEGVALRDDEKPRSVRDLGNKSFLVLRHHGLLTVVATIAAAFLTNRWLFDTECTIQVRALAEAGKWAHIEAAIIDGAQERARQVTRGMGASALTWPGLLRWLDRLSPGYDT